MTVILLWFHLIYHTWSYCFEVQLEVRYALLVQRIPFVHLSVSSYRFLLHCQTTQSFSIPCTIISGLSLQCINCPSIWLKHCSITHVRQAYLSAICHDIRQQPKLAWKRLSSVFGHIVHKCINYQNLNCPLLNGIYSYTIATIYENDLLDVFPAVLRAMCSVAMESTNQIQLVTAIIDNKHITRAILLCM